MGHPRRRFVHNECYFVTNRLAEGLPFVPNAFMNKLIEGILARAQARSPDVVVCTFDMLQNHYHCVVVLNGEPSVFSNFIHDIQDELARLVCKLLGKRNVKVWAQRFHAAKLGDYQAAVSKIVYGLANPVQAGFCKRVADWWGIGSWKYIEGEKQKICHWYRSKKLKKLLNAPFSKQTLSYNLAYLIKLEPTSQQFSLSMQPFYWKICFKKTRNIADAEIKEMIINGIVEQEIRIAKERKRERKQLADKELLKCQNPYKCYKPKSLGRRVYCICTDSDLRQQLIEEYQSFCEYCRYVWKKWSERDYRFKFPPGAFIPSQKPFANLILAPL